MRLTPARKLENRLHNIEERLERLESYVSDDEDEGTSQPAVVYSHWPPGSDTSVEYREGV